MNRLLNVTAAGLVVGVLGSTIILTPFGKELEENFGLSKIGDAHKIIIYVVSHLNDWKISDPKVDKNGDLRTFVKAAIEKENEDWNS